MNEVKGVKQLGRYFKQVSQSARKGQSGDLDDFLGCITVAVKDIPITGTESWFKLAGRSSRSKVQGSIHLMFKVTTVNEEDELRGPKMADIRAHIQLIYAFINYELKQSKKPSTEWSGVFPPEAEFLLSQHAEHAGLSEVHTAMCRWISLAKKYRRRPIPCRILNEQLKNLMAVWTDRSLTHDQMELLGNSFKGFTEHAILLISQCQVVFSPDHLESLQHLESLLRCLQELHQSRLFQFCSPFGNTLQSELTNAFKVVPGVLCNKRATNNYKLMKPTESDLDEFELHRDLLDNSKLTHLSTTACPITEVVGPRLDAEGNQIPYNTQEMRELFLLYRGLQEFEQRVASCLNTDEYLAQTRTFLGRIGKPKDLSSKNTAESPTEPIISESAKETVRVLNNALLIWKMCNWPDPATRGMYASVVVQAVCEAALFYAKMLHEQLRLQGYCDEQGQFDISDQLCVGLNNLESVIQCVNRIPDVLKWTRPKLSVEDLPPAAASDLSETDPVVKETKEAKGEATGEPNLEHLERILHEGVANLDSVLDRLFSRVRAKAIYDLLIYLESNFKTLRSRVSDSLFRRFLFELWSECLSQFVEQAHKEAEIGPNASGPGAYLMPTLDNTSTPGRCIIPLTTHFTNDDHMAALPEHITRESILRARSILIKLKQALELLLQFFLKMSQGQLQRSDLDEQNFKVSDTN
ncbi:unnamed protein product [Echinostoma caproni]|uniref:Uncharacterized protein n=1 Tax=Echinostoma caproni TaxID=27848 RepID=A0A3P8F8F9_9TREM|nr:unnamed protein product [Echinostoma caproni]